MNRPIMGHGKNRFHEGREIPCPLGGTALKQRLTNPAILILEIQLLLGGWSNSSPSSIKLRR